MLRVVKFDRASKAVEFGEPCMDDCKYSGDEYARRLLATNLHALTFGLSGWTVNGVRIGDAGITRDYLLSARQSIATQLASQQA